MVSYPSLGYAFGIGVSRIKMHALLLTIIEYSYIGIFTALGLGIIGLPIPDETLLAFAGFLSFKGKLSFFLTFFAAFLGTSCGITISYFLGKYGSNYISQKYSQKFIIYSDRLKEVEEFYLKYGKFALIIGYFIPGVRHLTAITAGVSQFPFWRFAQFAYTGAFLWTVTFLTFGFLIGSEWYLVAHFSNRIVIPIIVFLALTLFLVFYLRKK
jgi:membrane protein DedA with SNARE-associated domain